MSYYFKAISGQYAVTYKTFVFFIVKKIILLALFFKKNKNIEEGNMKIGKVRWTPFLICAPIAIIYYIIYRFNVIRITVFPWDIGIFIFNIGIILLIDRLLVMHTSVSRYN